MTNHTAKLKVKAGATQAQKVAAINLKICESSRRIKEMQEHLRTCSAEELHLGGAEMERMIRAAQADLRPLYEKKARLVAGVPEPTAAPIPKATARPPAHEYSAPPLPVNIKWPPVEGEADDQRVEREMLREFFEDIQEAAVRAAGANPTPATYTMQRHFELEAALIMLRRWARLARERDDALEARIEALEASTENVLGRGLFFSGVHQRSLGYEKASVVTFKGSTWAAIADVGPGEIPGESQNWQLIAKAGRDGKDAPAAMGAG